MARKIVVTSGKGGVGKTTICANLGFELAQHGNKVLLVDMDIGLNNLDVTIGIEKDIVFDMVDILEGKCRPFQALIQHKQCVGLYVLPCVRYCNDLIDKTKIKDLIDIFSEHFDYILIDCPAGIGSGFYYAISSATEVIVVCTPHITAVRDANKVLSILSNYYITNSYLVVNRYKNNTKNVLRPLDIANAVNIKLLGIIQENDDIYTLASFNGCALVDNIFSNLAYNLENDNVYTEKIKHKYFNRIKRV